MLQRVGRSCGTEKEIMVRHTSAPDNGIQLEIQGLDHVGQVIYLSLQNED
ncbi:hypothetical protein [Paenibacillus illinoisensis]|nr:hypothetical protein [Paenibacillus illinoisensis]MCM3204151.1 hypothetical protein [Paenibacillus illinoisensis]